MDQTLPLTGNPQRQATDSIRGYVYQIHQTIFHWLDLIRQPTGIVRIEAAEDFDVHTPDGATVNQVKDTAAPLTLASAPARTALANFFEIFQGNPGTVQYRYLTTATIGKEQKLEFPDNLPGITYWKHVQNGPAPIAPMRSELLKLDLHAPLKAWLASASDEVLFEKLVRRFHWCHDQPSLDGIICAIEQKLIHIGLNFALLPRDVSKAYPRLLQHVAHLASTVRNASLDAPTLVTLIQESATVQVSASTARRAMAESASTAHASNYASAPISIVDPPPTLRSLLFRERIVRKIVSTLRQRNVVILVGPTGIGKSALSYQAIDSIVSTTNQPHLEFRHADLQKAPAERLSATVKAALATAVLSPDHIGFFFDDLDFASTGADPYHLGALLAATRLQSGFCIFTTHNRPTPEVLALLDVPEDCIIQPDYFDQTEIAELAQRHGLKPDSKPETWASAIYFHSSGGHPQFAHALVVSLARRHWPTTKLRQLLKLNQVEEITNLKTKARKRLLETAPNQDVRTLAYRLSMITGTFSRAVAVNVGEIKPPVPNPGEAFDVLVGPWIEAKATGRFSVSPLLGNAAMDVLGADQLRQLHSDLAAAILKVTPPDPREIQSVIVHAQLGKNTASLKYATAIIQLNLKDNKAVANALWLLPLLADHDGKLYPEDAEASCLLRLCQFQIASLIEEPAKAASIGEKLILELDNLKSSMKDELFVMGAAYFASAPSVPVQPDTILHMATEAKRIERARSDLANSFRRMPNLVDVASEHDLGFHHFIFATASLKLASNKDFAHFLALLDNLPSEARDDLLRGLGFVPTGDNLFVNRGWISDLPPGPQGTIDSSASEEIYDRAMELFRRWGADRLFKFAVVCKSVVIDEYADDPERALAFLDGMQSDLKRDVYVQHQKAKILSRHGRHAEADAIWTVIGRQLDDLDYVDRAYAYRHAAISASQVGKWSEAIAFYVQAEAAAAQGSRDLKPMHIGFIADRALALALKGDLPEAISTLYKALKCLPSLPSDSHRRAHHVHATVRHAVAWLNARVARTVDPRLGRPEEELLAFAPGMCSNPEPHPDIEKHALQSAETMHLLLASAAIEMGCNPEIAQEYFAANGRMASVVGYFDYTLALCYRSLQDLDPTSLAMALQQIATAMTWFRTEANDRFTQEPIPALKSEDLLQPQVAVLLTDYAVAYLARSLMCGRDARAAGQELFDALHPVLSTFPLSLRAVLSFPTSLEWTLDPALREWCRALYQATLLLEEPRGTSLFLFRAINYLSASGCRHHVADPLADLAVERWLHFLNNMRFSLVAPNLYEAEVRDACASDRFKGLAKVADILLKTARTAKAPFDHGAVDFLTSIRNGTFQSSNTATQGSSSAVSPQA